MIEFHNSLIQKAQVAAKQTVGAALVHPGGVMWVVALASCVQVSGVSVFQLAAGSEKEFDLLDQRRSSKGLSFCGVGIQFHCD